MFDEKGCFVVANYVYHTLQCDDLVQKLKDQGSLTCVDANNPAEANHYKLDVSKCDPKGWADFAKSLNNPNENPVFSVTAKDSSCIDWLVKWHECDWPTMFVSKALPDSVIQYRTAYEGSFDTQYYVKDGTAVDRNGVALTGQMIVDRKAVESGPDDDHRVLSFRCGEDRKHMKLIADASAFEECPCKDKLVFNMTQPEYRVYDCETRERSRMSAGDISDGFYAARDARYDAKCASVGVFAEQYADNELTDPGE